MSWLCKARTQPWPTLANHCQAVTILNCRWQMDDGECRPGAAPACSIRLQGSLAGTRRNSSCSTSHLNCRIHSAKESMVRWRERENPGKAVRSDEATVRAIRSSFSVQDAQLGPRSRLPKCYTWRPHLAMLVATTNKHILLKHVRSLSSASSLVAHPVEHAILHDVQELVAATSPGPGPSRARSLLPRLPSAAACQDFGNMKNKPTSS